MESVNLIQLEKILEDFRRHVNKGHPVMLMREEGRLYLSTEKKDWIKMTRIAGCE